MKDVIRLDYHILGILKTSDLQSYLSDVSLVTYLTKSVEIYIDCLLTKHISVLKNATEVNDVCVVTFWPSFYY